METMEEYVLLCAEIAAEEETIRPTYQELAEDYADAWFDELPF